MNRSFLVVALLFTAFSGRSQSTAQNLPKVVSPSPNVAALQRYGDIPVSPYTGVPNISIPLYEIKAGDISVPISISYHASGIKVADEASRVGLGWSLNAGGVISKTVIGEDDFKSTTFGYHITNTTPDIPNGSQSSPPPTLIQLGSTSAVGGIANLPQLLNDGYSFQPDLYNFNVLNYSGKFYLKRNRDVVLAKKEKISIRCIDASANSWEILTEDGMKYLFEKYDTYTENENTGGAPGTVKSAWHLTNIISPKGQTVTFQYLSISNYIRPTGSFFESTNPNVFYASTNSGGTTSSPFPSVSKSSPGKDYTTQYIDKIIFNNGEVQFNYSTVREDIANDLRLDNITISSKDALQITKPIKKWDFIYGYFSGVIGNSFPVDATLPTISKRLKLISVTEKDGSNNSNPPYLFSYNNENDLQGTLPSKISFGRDHWGYYNGKNNNSSLIPNYTSSTSSDITTSVIGIQGNERDCTPAFSKLFSLNQIRYPTGGKTVFEYEANDFDIAKSKVNDQSFFANHPEAVNKSIQKMYTGPYTGELPISSDRANKVLNLGDMYVDQFTTSSSVSISCFFRFPNSISSCSIPYNSIVMRLAYENGTTVSGAGPIDLAYYLGSSTEPLSACSGSSGSFIGIRFNNSYVLSPGKYIWMVQFNNSSISVADLTLTVNYKALKESQPIISGGEAISKADFGGGLRIHKILDYERDNVTPKIKRYYYHYTGTDGNIYTYGKRMSRPTYTYFDDSYNFFMGGGGGVWTRSNHLIRESDSNVPLNGSAGGAVVGYDKVIVFEGENGENGKTEFDYENVPDQIWNYSQLDYLGGIQALVPRKPPVLGTIANAGNGNLVEQRVYENRSNNYVLLQRITNSYLEVLAQITSMAFGIEKRNYNNPPPEGFTFITYVYPTSNQSRKILSSTSTATYDRNNPLSFITTATNYVYNHTTHLQLISTSQPNSKGEIIKTDITYPLDYTDANSDAANLEMKGMRFMHSFPITKVTTLQKVDGTSFVVAGEINKSQVQGQLIVPKEGATLETNKGIVPSSLATYQPNSGTYPAGFMEKIKYELFDINGNFLQFKKADDIPLSFIWDYKGQYPIAEVKNAGQADIAYTSFEADGKGNWNNYPGAITTATVAPFPPTGDKYYNLISGASLSKAVTATNTYILSYWSKNGAYTVSGATGAATTGSSINGWTYYEHKLTASSSTLTIAGTGAIDEVRLYPASAQMSTYTYKPLVGMTSQCDPNNRIIYYEYDPFGRLKLSRDQDGKILKVYEYKYQQQ